MDVQSVTQTIQLIIAPFVMITACSIFLSALNGRYSVINDRLRAMTRERLDLLRASGGGTLAISSTADIYTVERLAEIDGQVPGLLRRHRTVRDSLLAVDYAITTFVATMFLIAVAVESRSAWVATAVLLLFVIGLGFLLVGVALSVLEIRASHVALHYEVNRVMSLGK